MNNKENTIEIRCKSCDEILCDDDILYVNQYGEAVGCGQCLHEEYMLGYGDDADE